MHNGPTQNGNDGAFPDPPPPLTADIAFKYVFGHEESTGILRSLLSAIQTDAGFPEVAEVRIGNPFNFREFIGDKLSIVDVPAVDVTDRAFTVEMQTQHEAAFLKRALYYWAKTHAGQIVDGEDYRELSQTVGVNILDYVLYPDRSAMHTAFMLSATDDPVLRMTDDLLIHTIELPKRRAYLSTALGRWSYVLGRERTRDMYEDKAFLDILKESPDIRAAEERYRKFLADPQLQSLYRAREKGRMVQAARLHEARQEGIEQGIEQGRRKTSEETARRMKEMGLESSVIAQATGLTEDEIDGL